LENLDTKTTFDFQRDEIPISKILPSTMESFLNEFCLKSKKPVTDGDFELTFNYSFLAPPVIVRSLVISSICHLFDTIFVWEWAKLLRMVKEFKLNEEGINAPQEIV